MVKVLSEEEREQAAPLLVQVTFLQHEFWYYLSQLEEILGVDIDSNLDLDAWTLDSLMGPEVV